MIDTSCAFTSAAGISHSTIATRAFLLPFKVVERLLIKVKFDL